MLSNVVTLFREMIMSPVVCLSAISCLALGAAVLAGQQEARPLRIEGSETLGDHLKTGHQ